MSGCSKPIDNMSKNKPSTSMKPVDQETGLQSDVRSCIKLRLPTHLVKELNVVTVSSSMIDDFKRRERKRKGLHMCKIKYNPYKTQLLVFLETHEHICRTFHLCIAFLHAIEILIKRYDICLLELPFSFNISFKSLIK